MSLNHGGKMNENWDRFVTIKTALRNLDAEAREESAENPEFQKPPTVAYKETQYLLNCLSAEVRLPEISYGQDGSIGLEWRPEGGIATISIYGDKKVIYGIFHAKGREMSGICHISDEPYLNGFFQTLKLLYKYGEAINRHVKSQNEKMGTSTE